MWRGGDDDCRTGKPGPSMLTPRQQKKSRGDPQAVAAFADYLRPTERILYAAEASGLYSISTQAPELTAESWSISKRLRSTRSVHNEEADSNQHSMEEKTLTHVAIIAGGGRSRERRGGTEAAVVGIKKTWLASDLVAFPIFPCVKLAVTCLRDGDPAQMHEALTNLLEETDFVITVPSTEVCEALINEFEACAAMHPAFDGPADNQEVPWRAGEFDWLWSYIEGLPDRFLPSPATSDDWFRPLVRGGLRSKSAPHDLDRKSPTRLSSLQTFTSGTTIAESTSGEVPRMHSDPSKEQKARIQSLRNQVQPQAEPLRIFTLTCNCGAERPPDSVLQAMFAELPNERPTIVAVGLQEVCDLRLAASPMKGKITGAAAWWSSRLDHAIRAATVQGDGRKPIWSYGRPTSETEYVQLRPPVSLVGLLLCVWVRSDMLKYVCFDKVKTANLGLGRVGMGNKGCVAVSLQLQGMDVCILNAHLPAGDESFAQERANDMYRICMQTYFGQEDRNPFEHDLVIWCGDFNGKLSADNSKATNNSAEATNNSAVFPGTRDELTLKRRRGTGALALFEEATIDFAPTYKLKPGEVDVYNEKRDPAWCDRVLWWTPVKAPFWERVSQPRLYRSLRQVTFSDHRPVVLSLEVENTAPPEMQRPFSTGGYLWQRLHKFANAAPGCSLGIFKCCSGCYGQSRKRRYNKRASG
eukprot:TRINITY_DN9022_c0_g2_i1.p1 TRINITY_DN9022_c0_g2~~TRINITY_DN9022_c0_g2_i1.p1  ORF type:complete len:697 (+),score=111.58 TRINITY_DN9022_c0_g2_i1:40-2130(+)